MQGFSEKSSFQIACDKQNQKAAGYFAKNQSWISHHISIANNLNTTLMRRSINMDFTSAGELAKLPQNKQERAYQLAKKMAEQDRRLSPSSRLVAKAVKKIQNDPAATIPLSNDESDGRWLKLTTLWNFSSCEPTFGFSFPGRIPGQIVRKFLYYFTCPKALVVDPFGGSGTALDVCRHMERRCLIYDLRPSRDDITRHDISHGFPKEALAVI